MAHIAWHTHAMLLPRIWAGFVSSILSLLLAITLAAAYEVPVSDADYDRQICSGMWGGANTFINGALVPQGVARDRN